MPGIVSNSEVNGLVEKKKRTKTIGSFRNAPNLKEILPDKLYEAIFAEIADDLDVEKLITVNPDASKSQHYLNHAAFGRAYDEVSKLGHMLQEFSENNPDVFYDQACHPLVEHTYQVLEDFFETENLLLVPNCTFGMKSVMDHLVIEEKHESIALLNPIYGATKKLLEYYSCRGDVRRLVKISPTRGKLKARSQAALFEEDPAVIVEALEDAYAMQEFSVLVCDQVASQSGRILPLEAVVRFCKENGIKLVVDGTQSLQIFFGRNKKVLDDVDYFVMSTHKWMGNIKTCGIIRFKCLSSPPCPPAISFGWSPPSGLDMLSLDQLRGRFLWQGMSNMYLPFICLARAVQIFSKYGETQMLLASNILEKGLVEALHLKPILPKAFNPRVINMFELQNPQFESYGDVTQIQNALQEYGIYVSVKKQGSQDCGDDRDSTEIVVSAQQCKGGHCNTRKLSGSDSGRACQKVKTKFYIRVSCWSYSNLSSFKALHKVFSNNLSLSSTTKAGLKQQFLYIHHMYEALFSTLDTKAFFIRAERLRHHLIFYFAHTAVFFINKLVISGFLNPCQRIDPRMESVMSVGVDEMSWDDCLEENYDWSGLGENELEEYLYRIRTYRDRVKELVLGLIDSHPLSTPITQGSLHWVILMGIEHEKIHLETSAVIISQVPIHLIKKEHSFNFPTYYDDKSHHLICPDDAPTNTLIRVPGGTVMLGRDHHGQDIYGWDNEFGSEKKVLKPFTASQMLVSNAEFLEFIEAGGYSENGLSKWWSEEGKRYVRDLGVEGPRFWIGRTHYRMMLEEIPMPWDFPVEVNNLEAEAFCRWKSSQIGKQLRLISHEESVHMRQVAVKQSANINMNKFSSPSPVNMFKGTINGRKVYDISGNVWRHSVSVLTIMEGFKTDPFYNDFTLPTIDGFHNHILGGSWISMGNCANLNARYGFRRHFYQYAGIRYVCSDNDYHDRVMKIFDGNNLGKEITSHFTNFTDHTLIQKKPIKNWPQRFGQLAADQINQEGLPTKAKILVAHGSVGRPALEILRNCQDLILDYSDNTANNLQVLEHLLDFGKVQWYQQVEGTLVELLEYHLDEGETKELLLKEKGNSISYWQADFTNMRPQLDKYQAIVVDFKYKDPVKEVLHLTEKLEDDGILILGSVDDLEVPCVLKRVISSLYLPVTSDGSLQAWPHIVRETRNKHQYTITHFTVWRKREGVDIKRGLEAQAHQEEEDTVVPAQYYDTEVYYEDKDILRSYDEFHFGEGLLGVKNFPQRMAEVCIEFCQKYGTGKSLALDAGCGPGRTALELSKYFTNVEAYDYSQGFINMLTTNMEKRGISNIKAFQGDSHKQLASTGGAKYDLVFGCNLIDRLHSPRVWVEQCKEQLVQQPGGILVISSPYTWRQEHTSPDQWIGGYLKDAENYFTVDGLKEVLSPELSLLEERKIPFVIPDKDGTFQYTYSNCTVFGFKA